MTLIENSGLRADLIKNAQRTLGFWPTREEYLKVYAILAVLKIMKKILLINPAFNIVKSKYDTSFRSGFCALLLIYIKEACR